MADVIISGVVRKLADIAGTIIAKEGSRLFELKENIAWIGDEMRCIKSFMQKADADDFIWIIWDLAYDLEDVMETYFPKLPPLRRNDWKWRLDWFLKAKTVRDFAEEIEEIKRRVVDIKRRREIYQVLDASGSSSGKQGWDPRETFSHTDEVNVIGMDEHIEKLKAKVTDQDSQHRVISITGMAGLGKTTLARKVYNSVRQNFECSAWMYVSRQPNPNNLLCEIARQVGLTEEECKDGLEGNLHYFLSRKRYLIVIDDIWEIEPWDALKKGIPVNSMNGSRIIITSRDKYIGAQIGIQNFSHELQPLDEEKSRELFFKMVMAASQDNDEDSDLSQLKNIGEKILKRCGGVPLAIVVIAGCLLSRERNIHAWKGVLESMGKDDDQCSKICALSYKDLPSMYKPCFLYFGLFPEDHEIFAFKLINLWAAEGFIHGSGVRAVEDVGQDYLNHLVGRNLIQVVERRFDGTVRICRIHDILHDLCIRKAREMNFFNTLNDVATSADCLAPRRVTTFFQSDVGNYIFPNFQTPKLRSLLCFDDDLTSDSEKQVKLCLRSSKSLRALIIRDYSPLVAPINEIMKLKHLYHLELRGWRWWDVTKLPDTISNLKNLLTLDLHMHSRVILPNAIWKMKQLRHILLNIVVPGWYQFDVSLVSMPHPFEVSLPNLQTFYGLPVEHIEANMLHKLGSLRRLKIYLPTRHTIEVLSSANSLLQRLEELIFLSPRFTKSLDLSNYVNLRKLHLERGVSNLPRHDKLPTCLTYLFLLGLNSKMDPLVTLKKLPRLETLIISFHLGLEKMVCSGEVDSFPQLKILKIFMFYLEEFVVEEGAMPKLKGLTLSLNKIGMEFLRMRVPDRIRNIITIDSDISG